MKYFSPSNLLTLYKAWSMAHLSGKLLLLLPCLYTSCSPEKGNSTHR
nr:unnamed protein product [Callosobruchus chinensis]